MPVRNVVGAEELIVDLIRELALATPAPRHDPFYGLDRPSGPSLRVLDRLTRHGDFRKYVTILDAGAGLGGMARWLTLRYACRVIALDPSAEVGAAGARLTRRARLTSRVSGLAAAPTAIPLRDGSVTQIWSVEVLHDAETRRRALNELFRVLRPGCTVALQEMVRRSTDVPPLGGAWSHGTLPDLLDDLEAVGFRHVEHDDVTAIRAETSPVVLSARARLQQLYASQLATDDPWHRAAAEERRVEAAVTGPDYRAVHIFAHRPSV